MHNAQATVHDPPYACERSSMRVVYDHRLGPLYRRVLLIHHCILSKDNFVTCTSEAAWQSTSLVLTQGQGPNPRCIRHIAHRGSPLLHHTMLNGLVDVLAKSVYVHRNGHLELESEGLIGSARVHIGKRRKAGKSASGYDECHTCIPLINIHGRC